MPLGKKYAGETSLLKAVRKAKKKKRKPKDTNVYGRGDKTLDR